MTQITYLIGQTVEVRKRLLNEEMAMRTTGSPLALTRKLRNRLNTVLEGSGFSGSRFRVSEG